MATGVVPTAAPTGALAGEARVPWMVWTATTATCCAAIGGLWDISWHISIGRDTFWTPPHLLIQACAAIGGLTAVYLIVRTTFFGTEAKRQCSVQVLGLRAPLGAFMSGWGALAMLTSAPFDNWWHEAYGLDVKVISPPHLVLAVGAMGVIFGGFLLTMSARNRAHAALGTRIETIFIAALGILMLGLHADLIEYSNRALMHSALFYRWFTAFAFDLLLARTVAQRRWACTLAATVYTLGGLAQQWILPLFPAEQKLSPVFQYVPHMVPLGFPVLILAPALAIDLAWPYVQAWRGWARALLGGTLFLGTFVTVQWPFADFLMSKRSANWIFGTHYQLYMVPPDSPFLHQFLLLENDAQFWQGMGAALVLSVLVSGLGIAVGTWLRSVKR